MYICVNLSAVCTVDLTATIARILVRSHQEKRNYSTARGAAYMEINHLSQTDTCTGDVSSSLFQRSQISLSEEIPSFSRSPGVINHGNRLTIEV